MEKEKSEKKTVRKSQEEKDAHSERMKKYWENKRKEKLDRENNTDNKKTENMETEKNQNNKEQVSQEQLEKLELTLKRLEEKEQKLDELLNNNSLVKGSIVEDRSHKKFGTSLRKEIPSTDRLESPKTYIYIGGIYIMSAYILKGSEVYAPYEKPIKFESEQLIPKKTEKGTKYFRISLYSTYSKSECKFIEESPLWGTAIFPNTSQATKIDMETSYQIQKASFIVDALTEEALLSMAIRYNIDKGLPMDTIRLKLKQYKLAEIIQDESRGVEETVKNIFLETAMLRAGSDPKAPNR